MEDQKGGNHITLPGNHPCLMMSCRQAAGTKNLMNSSSKGTSPLKTGSKTKSIG